MVRAGFPWTFDLSLLVCGVWLGGERVEGKHKGKNCKKKVDDCVLTILMGGMGSWDPGHSFFSGVCKA
jgi:hypothetical protein